MEEKEADLENLKIVKFSKDDMKKKEFMASFPYIFCCLHCLIASVIGSGKIPWFSQ